jgi:hypothetical protein
MKRFPMMKKLIKSFREMIMNLNCFKNWIRRDIKWKRRFILTFLSRLIIDS